MEPRRRAGLGGVRGVPERVLHVAGGEPRRGQRALGPEQHRRVAGELGPVEALLGRGQGIADAPQFDLHRHRLDSEQQLDVLAARGGGKRDTAFQVGERRLELPEPVPGTGLHPETGQARGQLLVAQPIERRARLVDGRGGVRAVRFGYAHHRRRRQGRRLEDRIADRAGVAERVADLPRRLAEVARGQRGQGQCQAQPDAVRGRLGRQLAEDDLQPPARVVVAAEQPLGVGRRHREAQALPVGRAAQSLHERVERPRRLARGGLRLRQQRLQPAPPLGLLRPVGQQSQRGGVELRGAGRRGSLKRAGGRRQQLDRIVVAGARRLFDVPGSLHRAGAAARERARRAAVRSEPLPVSDRAVDGVPHHRVTERELAGCARRPHHRARKQLVKRVQGLLVGELRDLGREPQLERISGHGGRVEQPASGGRERAQLALERGCDGALSAHVCARELLQEEGIAAALSVDRRGAAADQLDRLRLAERARPEIGEAPVSHGL